MLCPSVEKQTDNNFGQTTEDLVLLKVWDLTQAVILAWLKKKKSELLQKLQTTPTSNFTHTDHREQQLQLN